MKIRDLKKIIAGIPDDVTVSIYSSVADDEQPIRVVEHYAPGFGNTLMLLDKHAAPTACKVLWDTTPDEG